MPQAPTIRDCVFSHDRVYRYRLSVKWSDAPLLHWCMLNPSTADEIQNDPTVERCERRARRMGYGGIIVTNIFALRSTDPEALKMVRDPIGNTGLHKFDIIQGSTPFNDLHILHAAKESAMTICAWGNHGKFLDRGRHVRALLHQAGIKPYCLKVSGQGEPWHPLYVGYNVQPVPYEWE